MPEYLASGVYVEEVSQANTNLLFETLDLPDTVIADLNNLFRYVEKGYALKTNTNNHTIFITRGIAVLFAGPPGTGKTMTAKILASKLNRPLFWVDLSQVISKHIGETEKNLDKVFEKAKEAGAILLFDEADALFGKRTDINDPHNRYSYLEMDYLSHRLETFAGVVILTTNLLDKIDEALLHHFHTVIEFPIPEPTYRVPLWQQLWHRVKKHFP